MIHCERYPITLVAWSVCRSRVWLKVDERGQRTETHGSKMALTATPDTSYTHLPSLLFYPDCSASNATSTRHFDSRTFRIARLSNEQPTPRNIVTSITTGCTTEIKNAGSKPPLFIFTGSSLVYYDDADALSRLHYPSRPFSEISASNLIGEQVRQSAQQYCS